MTRIVLTCIVAWLVVAIPLRANADSGARTAEPVYFAPAVGQTETDAYTRYELLDPATASFRIYYEVTATTAGAKVYYNPIRKGSIASDESVSDAMLGTPLHFEVVSGKEALKDALMPDADPATDYIKVTLARPVPEHGQARIVILKTYKDAKSYHLDGKALVFDRPLGVQRNKVVLPPGYEVVGLNVPSQILVEQDGRIAISFLHAGDGAAPLVLRAVRGAQLGAAAIPRPATAQRSWESPFEGDTEEERLSERAHQDRDIVYFLQQPETHAFRLYHDYTESRAGISGYANVVRSGSTASDPAASIVDTGEQLKVEEMSGAELMASKLNTGETVAPTARVVVIPFTPIKAGQSGAAADHRDLHRARQLPARRRGTRVRPESRPATQRRRAAIRLVLHGECRTGNGEPAAGRSRPARLLG